MPLSVCSTFVPYRGTGLRASHSYRYGEPVPAPTDHPEQRRLIAMATWAAISQEGIAGTTLRKVAAAGDTSIGRIQHYFASREELLRFSCQAMVDLAADQQDAEADPHVRLRALLNHRFDDTERYRWGARVWMAYVAHAVVDPAIAEIVVDAQIGLEREIARLLDVHGADPAGALALLALSEGLAQRILTGTLSPARASAEMERALQVALGDHVTAAATSPSR